MYRRWRFEIPISASMLMTRSSLGDWVNVGLRYDYESPRTERYDRFTSFDFDRAFPIQVAALPGLKGVLTHPGQDGEPRSQFDPSWTNFGPRLGLAYRLNNRTAIRAGYGIFYSPKQGTTSGQGFGASGYELSTAWVASLDGVTPLNPLSNPYPTGLLIPPTTQADVLQVGQSINMHDRGNRRIPTLSIGTSACSASWARAGWWKPGTRATKGRGFPLAVCSINSIRSIRLWAPISTGR